MGSGQLRIHFLHTHRRMELNLQQTGFEIIAQALNPTIGMPEVKLMTMQL